MTGESPAPRPDRGKETVADDGDFAYGRDPSRQDVPPGTVVGRYLVLQRIGAGGMGVVYAAFDPELDRKVALKLLQPDALDGERASRGHARLVREAQAMAKLSHPNVVAVHDVGAFGSRVFVAMEFVAGTTLTQWAEAQPRPWRAMVDMYMAAGEGLAAAHARGLVHRDFKPDNVLVGEDGRPRVLDFGLARAPTDLAPPRGADDAAVQLQAVMPEGSGPIHIHSSLASLSGTGDEESPRLTKTGALAGTPAYMAPEQYRGQEIDARTDQFSFCVALWEALYGQRPFKGANRPALAMAVCKGVVTDPPEDAAVPAWVQRTLRRGLSRKPDERFPDMRALLTELARNPTRERQRRLMTGGLLVFPLAAVAGVWWPAPDPCAAGADDIGHVFGRTVKTKLRGHFAQTDARYAAGAAEGAIAQLDAYADAWADAHRAACEATHVKHEQSEHRLDLRMTCLAERRFALQTTVSGLLEADARTIGRAGQAIAALPSVADCADVEQLEVAFALPEDPALADKVTALRQRGAELDATLRLLGTADDPSEYEAHYEEVEATGHAPLIAEAAFLRALTFIARGDAEGAQHRFEEAAYWAHAAGNDKLVARAYTRLAHVSGILRSNYDDGLRWGRLAAGVVASIGEDSSEAMDHASTMCKVLADKGDAKEGLPYCERALQLARARAGGSDFSIATGEEGLGIAYYIAHDYDRAQAHFEAAREGFVRTTGDQHPNHARVLNSLAAVCYGRDGADACAREFERALEATIAAFGPDHPTVADVSNNLAQVLVDVGRVEEARQYANEGLRVRRAATAGEHPGIAASLRVLALADQRSGEPLAALQRFEEALPIAERTRGEDHPDVLRLRTELGDLTAELGRTEQARAHYDAAIAIARRRDDTESLTPLLAAREALDAEATEPAKISVPSDEAPVVGATGTTSTTPSPADSDRTGHTGADRPPRSTGE